MEAFVAKAFGARAALRCGGRTWRSSVGLAHGFALGLSAGVIVPGAIKPVPEAEEGIDESTFAEPTLVGKFVRPHCGCIARLWRH